MDFNKTFKFVKENDWTIPKECNADGNLATVQQDEVMMELKSELNGIKEQLSGYDIGTWHQHTTRMNPASKVVKTVSTTLRPKPFCSNAWCKFYELLVTLRLLDGINLTHPLHSVHLCEAPGGFICALNHFVNSEYRGLEHDWLANTLNPYHERSELGQMIPDDRLIRHSLDRWLFGADNTGDVTKSYNIQHIIQEAKSSLGSHIQLVTADGSLDCQLSPSEQEMIVYPLILAEVFTALSLLDKGGVAVIKMFTLFEVHTVSLLYTLNTLFDKVDIHKPVTSKPGNSEVYVVCRGLLECVSAHTLSLIQSAMDTGCPLMNLTDLPDSFLQQARAAVEMFKCRQVETITRNMSYYGREEQIPAISNEKYAKEYLSTMNLKPVAAHQSIVQVPFNRAGFLSRPEDLSINSYGSEIQSLRWQPRKRRLSGNYSQRCNNFTAEHRLRELVSAEPESIQQIKFLFTFETNCPANDSPLSIMEELKSLAIPSHMKSWSQILNSCFCDGSLLTNYNVLAEHFTDTLQQSADLSELELITQFTQKSLPQTPAITCLPSNEMVAKENNAARHNLIVIHNILEDISIIPSIFKHMKAEDSLLVHNINCLSRLGASIVFLLWHCFDEVGVAGHDSSNNLPSILFKRSILTPCESLNCINRLSDDVIPLLSNQMTLLSLFPTPEIMKCSKLHNQFLCDINNETLRRSINSLTASAKNSLLTNSISSV